MARTGTTRQRREAKEARRAVERAKERAERHEDLVAATTARVLADARHRGRPVTPATAERRARRALAPYFPGVR